MTAIETTPDITVTDHPIFSVFEGQRNSFLSVAKFNFHYAPEASWQMPIDGDTKSLATLHNGAPFVLEKQYGQGRVVAQYVKLSPKPTELGIWSNWSLNPVFPVYANELIGYLSASQRNYESNRIGDSLSIELAENQYEAEVRISSPGSLEGEQETITPQSIDGFYSIDIEENDSSGIWQIDLQPKEGNPEKRLLAVNVDAIEGDLQYLDRDDLATRLKGIDYEFSMSSQMSTGNEQLAGFRLSDMMFYSLLFILVMEQWLAYSASYHAKPIRTS